jgi:hypothetical protein
VAEDMKILITRSFNFGTQKQKILYDPKMKIRAPTDDEQKMSLATELMLHTARKKCFYNRL